MTLGASVEIFAFAVFSFIAIAGALGMTTTMSMFRSGIFLMASFIGVAGLFILLLADLLGLLQIMMYIGGMLVMILFMLLFSGDPGGAIMAKMQMPPLEKFFSLGLLPRKNHETDDGHEHGQDGDHDDMDMGDMSMMTPIKTYAAWISAAVGAVLIVLLLLFPVWPVNEQTPDPDSARRVGELLMDKYMIAFEGAGLLILLGIFGAVFISRPGKYPDSPKRGAPSAVDEPPARIENDKIPPIHPQAEGEDGSEGI